ncbi:activating transcription factor 7-interacting protein 1 isoform X2 [Sardina pilchardus]|uniref:activating transcription factor 7-interacting protein 1 isoform X2 n=1 Tax=Sardina pilchardus TaxID=27697 RepID=UPI002E11AA0E
MSVTRKKSMKRKRSPESQLPGPQTLSKTDIEDMVNSKVRLAIEELESTRKEQQQKMKDLDADEKHFDEKLKKLKAHIQKVKRRGDAAMAYIRHRSAPGKTVSLDQKSGLLRSLSTTPPAESCAPGVVTSSRNSDSGDGFSDGWLSLIENDVEEVGSQSKRKAVEGFWQGWRGRMQMVDLTAEDIPVDLPVLSPSKSTNAASPTTIVPKEVKVKMEEGQSSSNGHFSQSTSCPPQRMSPPPPSPQPSPSPPLRQVKAEPESPKPVSIKTEETPYDISESAAQKKAMNTSQVTSTIPTPSSLPAQANTTDSKENKKGANDPKVKKILVRDANVHGDNWKQKLHPLPDTPFPLVLSAVAASKNVPQKLMLKVVRMTDTAAPSICLIWAVQEEDPHAPPMDSYYIYVAQENQAGDFSRWSQIGHVTATPLPMACRLSDYASNRRLCFVMVGKDQFGRYGPYSEVECIYAKSAKPS